MNSYKLKQKSKLNQKNKIKSTNRLKMIMMKLCFYKLIRNKKVIIWSQWNNEMMSQDAQHILIIWTNLHQDLSSQTYQHLLLMAQQNSKDSFGRIMHAYNPFQELQVGLQMPPAWWKSQIRSFCLTISATKKISWNKLINSRKKTNVAIFNSWLFIKAMDWDKRLMES